MVICQKALETFNTFVIVSLPNHVLEKITYLVRSSNCKFCMDLIYCIYEKYYLFRILFIVCVCVLHEPITVHCTGQAGHGRGPFLRKDDSCENTLAFHMNLQNSHVLNIKI